MKPLTAFLTFLLLASAFIPCLTVKAEPSLIPHEDPAAAQSAIDTYSFLTQYADILALAASRRYSEASDLNAQLSHITVPESLAYIVNRYNSITGELIDVLNQLDGKLNEASSMLNQYRLDEAGKLLDQAAVLVTKAQILINDLQEATQVMSQRLGLFSALLEDKVKNAYNSLQSILQRLQDLIDLYHSLLNTANQRLAGIESAQLQQTAVSFQLNGTRCNVGGHLLASGVLTANGQALPNRVVQIVMDENIVASATTKSDGSYTVTIAVPYIYVNQVSLYALYTPQGSDRGAYLASLSTVIKLQLLFYETNLEIIFPAVAYPGLSMSVKGNVTSMDRTPLGEREVQVLLDGKIIARSATDRNGSFILRTNVEAQTKLGEHILTVKVGSSGLYAGASQQRSILIKQMPTTLQFSLPSIVILPSQLVINGTVFSGSAPLKEANVWVEFANQSSYVRTGEDGSFTLLIDVPIGTVFVGNQEVSIIAQPSEPWQAATYQTRNVLMLNSVGIVTALASSFLVSFFLYFKIAKPRLKSKSQLQKSQAMEAYVSAENETEETAVPISPQFAAKKTFDGIIGRVVKAYVQALTAVQSATGCNLRATMTLREYLESTTSKLGQADNLFADLTLLTERSLYSPHAPNEEDATTADELANKIGRIMSSGNA